ncbi:MAG: DNA mismatch repair endonuclease MutL [Candidatus Dependentiae bacterium]
MHKIHKLPTHEAQKIAAGEVVERPSNLLKELLENAIDAQSSKIAIHIKDGGKELIRVVDNGYGMSPEDAILCFEQHATSKITHVDQLQEIVTFGFRGEALASIAAVGKTTLITKEKTAEHGTKIHIEQNSIIQKENVSAINGTDISVKDIFHTLPARQKFLKKRETEWRQIQQLFFAVALAHLHIDFKLYAEDKLIYNCTGTDTIAQRWQQLFDHHTAQQMITATHEAFGVSMKGLISDHQLQRYDRNSIYLFVNNRWIKDSKLTRAFIKGYQNVLPPARYPTGCLFITIDPQEVDINIHPRKEEVQFLHPRRVEREIQICITQALEQQLSAQLNKTVHIKQNVPFESQPHTQPTPTFSSSSNTHFSPFNFDEYLNKPAFAPTDTTLNSTISTPEINNVEQLNDHSDPHQAITEEKNSVLPESAKQQYELIGQYKKTYLLLEQENGLFLLDQHAAHERILYEQFVAQHNNVTKVQLLFPQVLTLPKEDISIIEKHITLFSRYGIELEPFGEDTVKIQATPVHLKNVALDDIIKQTVGWINEYKELASEQFEKEMQKKLYADMACKAAVKAGDTLSREQMQQLLVDLEKTENRFLCPHGRPTSFLFHHDEIKKKFKRDYRSQKTDT